MKKRDSYMIREHFIFKGEVQGVGFRYRAKNTARGLGLTGWVRNLYDGSVEMELQGPAQTINDAPRMINSGTYIDIIDMDRKTVDVDPDENSFKVRM